MSLGALVFGRIIMGFGGDLNGLVLGYYVTEVAPKNVRGRSLILVQQFASSFIAIAGYWIAYGESPFRSHFSPHSSLPFLFRSFD